jgi:hypothetical protein
MRPARERSTQIRKINNEDQGEVIGGSQVVRGTTGKRKVKGESHGGVREGGKRSKANVEMQEAGSNGLEVAVEQPR